MARTLLGIEKIGLPNVGILLDFGHALFGGESPADSAQLAIDYGRLFGMDVNDNFRAWDDDLVAGTRPPDRAVRVLLHPGKNDWQRRLAARSVPVPGRLGPGRNDAIDFLKAVQRALAKLDIPALRRAQESHDAITALSIAQKALFSSY